MAEYKAESGKVGKALKKYPIANALVWLPITITIWAINYIVSVFDQLINLLPPWWQLKNLIGFDVPELNVIPTVAASLIAGLFGANALSKRIIPARDGMSSHTSVVKSTYTSVKKISESLLSDGSRPFKTSILAPFPRPKIQTLAFAFGSTSQALQNSLSQDEKYISVYIPATPNPTGGYYIMMKRSDVYELDMSVDEILKCVISLGMVMPDRLPVKPLGDGGQSGRRISQNIISGHLKRAFRWPSLLNIKSNIIRKVILCVPTAAV